MSIKAGLDFGTTFSTISCFYNNKLFSLKLNGTEYIPTCLSITPNNEVIVGGPSQVLEASETPSCYFYDLKRWVGVTSVNYEVVKAKINPMYKTRLSNNKVYITGINKGFSTEFSVEQLILHYVNTLVRLFSKTENLKITDLNVSVPADYKSGQRLFMQAVCSSLGFNLRRIVNEPSAAAIYCVSKYPQYAYFYIYDFGGGTFDTSLIVRYGKFVTVADTQGDSFLGGRDIDKAISKFIMDKNALNAPLSADMLASIKEETNSTGRSSYNIISDDGSIINIQFTFDDLVKCVEPFTRRSFSILRSLVSRNKTSNGALFLVGGSSLLRPIQNRADGFARNHGLALIIDPDLRAAVSFGCSMLHAQEDSGNMTYIDCNSHPLMDLGLYCHPRIIIRKPMSVPYTHKIEREVTRFITTALNVYEGSDLFVLNNDWLISADVDYSKYAKMGETLVSVYKYTIDGILELSMANKTTGKSWVLPNTFARSEKIVISDLTLTQLSNVDELATIVSILSYFDATFNYLISMFNTPSIFEREVGKISDAKGLYNRLVEQNRNFS
uniref:Heat shock 70-like protein n=1 Tax=Tomato chlorosis virus TaxID=67754 RepID=D5MRD4_9CLOS|nr:Hsp70 [Tomato chlorosis virus]WOJ43301.1 heat shock protein 70 [Cucumber mosaic virus]AGQ04623.1 heat shock 70-like protein [Tomato chlorosis virus]AGQ04624.1 heat shock 70-like protein [Tomato chlorosis virus]AJS10668.1 Hsp70 [Tomato chlorosis virus]